MTRPAPNVTPVERMYGQRFGVPDPIVVWSPVLRAHLIYVAEGMACAGCQAVHMFFESRNGVTRCVACPGRA